MGVIDVGFTKCLRHEHGLRALTVGTVTLAHDGAGHVRSVQGTHMATVLVVDDDADIRLSIRSVLRLHGYDVREAADGQEALRAIFQHHPDVILLDVAMPVMDGFALLERIRDFSDIPVVMLSARGLQSDRVRGLRAGADDYVVKPYSNAELVARLDAVQRRTGREQSVGSYRDALLDIDFERRQVTVGGLGIELSTSEFTFLAVLVKQSGRPLAFGQLNRLIWGDDVDHTNARLKFVVHRLRQKVRKVADVDLPIESVRGVGYRYILSRGHSV